MSTMVALAFPGPFEITLMLALLALVVFVLYTVVGFFVRLVCDGPKSGRIEGDVQGPRGVGGWLTFFCVSIAVLSPLGTFGELSTSWEKSKLVFELFPSIRAARVWENWGAAAISVFGIITGWLIWIDSPRGRTLARRYLIVRVVGICVIDLVAVDILTGVGEELQGALERGMFAHVIAEMIFFAIWWLYFEKSKRVRNTYPAGE